MKQHLQIIRRWIKSCKCSMQLNNAYGIYENYLKNNDCSQFELIKKSIEELYQQKKQQLKKRDEHTLRNNR